MTGNKLHFREIDWVIYFPSKGNKGRQLINYGVAYRDRVNSETQPGPKINLGDVLARPEIRNRYPHRVGLFLESSGKGENWKPAYVEDRIIQSENDLLSWIAQIEEE
jgi:hypothetical protein